MRTAGLLLFLLWSAFGRATAGEAETAKDEPLNYSLNTGSFIFHAYAPHKEFTQYFQNRLVALERRTASSFIDSVVLGTFINSEGNRCLLLGVQKNWFDIGHRTTFEGVYAYAGEFFFETFSECGRSGPYASFERATGIGFAPYVYHGIEYDLNRHVSLEGGIILPGIIVLSVQWHF